MGGEIFRTCPDRPWGPPSLLYNGYRAFPEGKERPGRDADPSPPSSAVVMKGSSYTSTPPIGRTACTEPQCLYKGDLYFSLTFLPRFLYQVFLTQHRKSLWGYRVHPSVHLSPGIRNINVSYILVKFIIGYFFGTYFSRSREFCAKRPGDTHT